MIVKMPDIVFLHKFPQAASFCSEYIIEHWSWTKEMLEELVKPCLSDNNGVPFILIAKEEGKPIGLILAAKDNAAVSKEYSPWLLLLYVKKEYRNKGIGTTLLERACEELKRCGYDTVYLDTVKYADYYRKRGWTFLGTKPWKDKITNIFSKKLT